MASLAARVASAEPIAHLDAASFAADPLARWLESTFGVVESDGALVRARPQRITGAGGAAEELASLTGLGPSACARAIAAGLSEGSGVSDPESRAAPFAFRLHQFVSRGSSPMASPEPEDHRYVTTVHQRFVPGDRARVLLPLACCRECGQDYYVVEAIGATGPDGVGTILVPRELGDRDTAGRTRQLGFLHISASEPWPADPAAVLDRLPED